MGARLRGQKQVEDLLLQVSRDRAERDALKEGAQGHPQQTRPTAGLRSTEGAKNICLLYTSPSPRDRQKSRMPSSA